MNFKIERYSPLHEMFVLVFAHVFVHEEPSERLIELGQVVMAQVQSVDRYSQSTLAPFDDDEQVLRLLDFIVLQGGSVEGVSFPDRQRTNCQPRMDE